MSMTRLKHEGQWDFLALMFRLKGPTFDRIIVGFIKIISRRPYEIFAVSVDELYPMSLSVETKKSFRFHSYCRYAVDVTFQQTDRPMGSIDESKPYYSADHKLY